MKVIIFVYTLLIINAYSKNKISAETRNLTTNSNGNPNAEVTTKSFDETSTLNATSSFSTGDIIADLTTTPESWSTTQRQHEETCNIRNPFNCRIGGGCIARRDFCDSTSHCSDGSDETWFNRSLHQDMGIRCLVLNPASGAVKPCFLPNEYKCDHEIDCTLGEDECDCDHTMVCDTSPFPLISDKQCIARSQFCDNVKHCYDGSDEKRYSPGAAGYQCAVTKTRVTSYCELPTVNVCDGIADCQDATDECFCDGTGTRLVEDSFYNGRCFRCLDKLLDIPKKQLCDGKFQCQDLSDECLCSTKPAICNQVCKEQQGCKTCKLGEIMCQKTAHSSVQTCIEKDKVCDQTFDCPLREDEADCGFDFSQHFSCDDDSKFFPHHRLCDGVQDCGNGYDEINCQSNFFECSSHRGTSNTNAYDFRRPRYAMVCDGIPTCEDLEDECNETLCGTPLPEYCAYVGGKTGFICPGTGIIIVGTEVCDGFPTCSEFPNSSADEMGCPNRFYCQDRGSKQSPIHIPLSALCDGVSDCFDESDETGCSETTHFYCSSKVPKYLPRSKICNGIQDCSDGEDECQGCSTGPFSSDGFLINSSVLEVLNWIIGLFAAFGNIGVLFHNAYHFIKHNHSLSVAAFNQRILIISLALADLLLGLYLIGLGVINSVNKGIYCGEDKRWRSSTSCVAIGTMAVISIECSVFLFSIMATMRLIQVTRPCNFSLQRRCVIFGVLFAWFVSFLLALIPLSSSLTDYFTSEMWYQHNPFLGLVNRQMAEDFIKYLWALRSDVTYRFMEQSDGTFRWEDMIRAISQLNDSFVPSLQFGYYSAHGVCLPRLFPDPFADRSWGFSLFLIVLNFLAFVYMTFMFIVISVYKITVKNSRRAGGVDEDEAGLALQHKISRIIFSNFCCWIPICIMAFISAGGGYVSQEAYAVSAIVLLPINSALNPFLYSVLPELIGRKFMACTAFGNPGAEGFQCAVTKTSLTSHCMLSQRYVCDGISDCNDATDECFCTATGSGVETNAFLNDHCFRCLDFSLVIPKSQFCDNTFHCQDLTDECLCVSRPKICDQICKVDEVCGPCTIGQVICQREDPKANITCIDRTDVCNGEYDCPLHDDELNCNTDLSNVFNCTDGSKYIPKHQRCDNLPHCGDNSDEINCSTTFFECSSYYFMTGKRIVYDFGRPRYAVACDKIPTCEDLEDECNETLCGTPLPEYCTNVQGSNGYICPGSKISIIGTQICDGFPTCSQTFDDHPYDEKDCPERFYCQDEDHKRLHVPLSAVCNGLADCYDASDETNCSLGSHFYCSSNIPVFLDRSKVCNGIQDCSDGEDECQDCLVSSISSDKFLVNSFVLQGLIWVMAVFAVCGNAGVIYHNTKQFIYNRHSLSEITFNHRILVTNLAFADLILGIYLVMLGVANEVFRGIYCRKDIQWRSSSYCVAMGCLTVISIISQVLILLIMVTMRLFFTVKPFTAKLHRRHIYLAIGFAWIISIIIAVIPLAEVLSDYFISELWYQDNHLPLLANRKTAETLVTSLWSLQENSSRTFTNNLSGSLTWKNMIEAISRLNENYVPTLYLGFYSAHGVCLPRIFPDPSSDRSWGYSLFIVTFIFVAFIYMLVAYITIYRVTVDNTRRSGMVCDEDINKQLQKKISQIMFVNFFCWIPICIMAFISAGGYVLPSEAYAMSAIFLLPINSAFDPIVYSNLPEVVWKKFFEGTQFEKWITSKIAKLQPSKDTQETAGQGDDQAGRRSTGTTLPPP